MRIDAHHHVWDLAVRDQPWTAGQPVLHRSFGFDKLRPKLAAHGIEGTVLVQTLAVADETPELLDLAEVESRAFGVVGWVDLTDPGVAERLAGLRERPGGHRLAGIRHALPDEPDPRWICRPDVSRGLSAVAAAGLVYDLLIEPPQFAATVEAVTRSPQLHFVLDHAGGPPIGDGEREPWQAMIDKLARRSNVSVKLSGLVTQAGTKSWTARDFRPCVNALFDTFGPDRVMFGSDWPVCLLAASYDEVVDLAEQLTDALSSAERAAVFGGTAARVYGLTSG